MQTRNRNTFTTIHTEGALLPVDLLQRISENDTNLDGLDIGSYHLAPGEKLNEAINRSWNRLNGLWVAFQAARARLGSTDAGTTLTRERWLLPLFQELGFGRLSTSKAVEIEGKTYPISHRWQNVPLHLVGCGLELDKRTPGAAGAARISPHSLLQEYLNRSEDAQWGLLSNGLSLRIIRDNATLTRQAYLDFDLESMFEGEVYSDFVLLWLVCHQSRFEIAEKETDCILERWSKNAQESGTRALDDLRRGVEDAIVNLGQGFLQHPLNSELRARLKIGDLSAQDYYRQLLRLVYRLIFLFAAEDRDLLLLPDSSPQSRKRYMDFYSTARLRLLAERQRGSRHHDRFESLRSVMTLLGSDQGCPPLAIPALGGFLFDPNSTPDLNDAKLDNQSLLTAVRSLAFITENGVSGRNAIRRAVDYRNLGSEELGSVYESLLELHPILNTDAGTFSLLTAAGNERRTTGSYYTPSSPIQVLLDSALNPVIENALEEVYRQTAQENSSKEKLASLAAERLLSIKVCDPACGIGHFLIGAAHRIAARLAQVRAGGDEPSPSDTRRALRDVIRHCIYGVDLNPMAVELCKVNLWLESLDPGKPLSFLDAHIKCGNSLVGVGPRIQRLDAKGSSDGKENLVPVRFDDLEIPDEAFKPVTGDDRTTATALQRRNRAERAGQLSLHLTVLKSMEDLQEWLASQAQSLTDLPEETATDVHNKATRYQALTASQEYRQRKQIADLWTAAFFWQIKADRQAASITAPTQGELNKLRRGLSIAKDLDQRIVRLSEEVNFFHWELEFPEVFALIPNKHGTVGFDCVLGNPPWERIKLQEEEFFAARDPEIATAPNKAARQKLIDRLTQTNPALALAFEEAKHAAECISKFVRTAERFPLTAVGDVNTYALFAEHARDLSSAQGRVGIIVPTGIATDDTTKDFFGDLVEKRALASLFDFENKEAIFPGVHRSYKFCLLTLSATAVTQAQFVFFATRVEHLRDERRRFSLNPSEIALFNPNTRTMPVFRTRMDAELTRKIYQRVPVLVNERTGENPWGISFLRMFDMSNDSGLFASEPREGYVRLYEAKMVWHFNHRWATFSNSEIKDVTYNDLINPYFSTVPRYWISAKKIDEQVKGKWENNWFLSYRRITNANNERTMVSSIVPKTGITDVLPLQFTQYRDLCSILLANYNSLCFDYVTRQKIGGLHIDFHQLRQFPVLPPTNYSRDSINFITSRALELVYTAWDIQPFADDLWRDASPGMQDKFIRQWEKNAAATSGGHRGVVRPDWCEAAPDGFPYPPFKWDEDRRAVLRAELDAYYARLYGLTRDELRYILDPQDVYGPDFPGETFRVLKEKEIRKFGEYRTRRLVLEAWDRFEGIDIGSVDTSQQQPIEISETPEVNLPPQVKSERKPVEKPPVRDISVEKPTEAQKTDAQLTFSDYGTYQCEVCGKMVVGFVKDNHEREQHGGKSVAWKKIR